MLSCGRYSLQGGGDHRRVLNAKFLRVEPALAPMLHDKALNEPIGPEPRKPYIVSSPG